jgi:hypothetical protein
LEGHRHRAGGLVLIVSSKVEEREGGHVFADFGPPHRFVATSKPEPRDEA